MWLGGFLSVGVIRRGRVLHRDSSRASSHCASLPSLSFAAATPELVSLLSLAQLQRVALELLLLF